MDAASVQAARNTVSREANDFFKEGSQRRKCTVVYRQLPLQMPVWTVASEFDLKFHAKFYEILLAAEAVELLGLEGELSSLPAAPQ